MFKTQNCFNCRLIFSNAQIFFLVALFSFTSAAKSFKNSTPLEDVTADNEIHQEDLEPQGSVLSYR